MSATPVEKEDEKVPYSTSLNRESRNSRILDQPGTVHKHEERFLNPCSNKNYKTAFFHSFH
jgi:hypothetical protein